jgi:DNA-binding transcriptional regulator YhcF (GntR family)
MKISLDRQLPVPLQVQLKGQIEYGILSGALSPGIQLPSIRELAQEQDLAPATVSQVYQELQREGLLVSRAGLGTFVADLGFSKAKTLSAQARSQELRRIVDQAIDEALALGFTTAEINQMLASRLGYFHQLSDRPRIALVGIFERVTPLYARDIEHLLRDLHVQVEWFTLEELHRDFSKALRRMQGIHLVTTPAHRLQEVTELLDPVDKKVVGIIFVLSQVTRERLLGLTPGLKIAVITTFPEFLSTMIQGIGCYYQFETEPLCAVIVDEATVLHALSQAQAVIYATGSERVLDLVPPGMQAVEYLHTPDPASVERLRPLIVAPDGSPYREEVRPIEQSETAEPGQSTGYCLEKEVNP